MNYLQIARKSLEAIRRPTATGHSNRESPSPSGADFSAVTEMSLDEFANAGLILRVHSEVLDCEVLFVSDDVPDHDLADDDLPVYRAAELRRLAVIEPKPHTLRCIHEVKAVFNGVISHAR